MDINQELDPKQLSTLQQVIRDNLRTFAFGSRKLGQTNLVTMNLETGDTKPISSAP
jgi:hypothetical protein